MTRVLTFCLLVLSSMVSMAHAGELTFHRDKPADMNAKGQDRFKAGELIYAVAKLDKTLSELDNGRKQMQVEVRGPGGGFDGIVVPITDANKSAKQVGFYIVGPGNSEQTTKTFVNWIGQQSGTVKLTIGIGGGHEAVGKFTIDMSPGAAAYASIVEGAAKQQLAANASVALPKAVQKNPKLEKEIVALIGTTAPNLKVHKVFLTLADWNIDRHPQTGVIVRRTMLAALLLEDTKTGECTIDPSSVYEQQSTGPNKWGKLAYGGVSVERPIKVPCARFKQP